MEAAKVTPTLGYESLRRARATVEDFARSYFFLHGLPLDVFLNFMDVLLFVEASLYESDERNEEAAEAGGEAGREATAKPTLEDAEERDVTWRNLCSMLRRQGLLDAAVRAELERGLEYWQLERRLAARPLEASIEDAERAVSLKSFDYRVLNLLLYQLRRAPYDENMISFLWEAERLVEIEDDLKDYNKDVVRNSFNVYRTYVRIHRAQAPDEMRAFIAQVEQSYLRKRDEALDATLLARHIARNEEQESAGPAMAPSTGVWQIPVPCLDEAKFRCLAKVSDGTLPVLFVPQVSGRAVSSAGACQSRGDDAGEVGTLSADSELGVCKRRRLRSPSHTPAASSQAACES